MYMATFQVLSVASTPCVFAAQDMKIDEVWKLKVLATTPYFNFHFFSTLADIFAVERPLLCTKLVHQSSPAEMAY